MAKVTVPGGWFTSQCTLYTFSGEEGWLKRVLPQIPWKGNGWYTLSGFKFMQSESLPDWRGDDVVVLITDDTKRSTHDKPKKIVIIWRGIDPRESMFNALKAKDVFNGTAFPPPRIERHQPKAQEVKGWREKGTLPPKQPKLKPIKRVFKIIRR